MMGSSKKTTRELTLRERAVYFTRTHVIPLALMLVSPPAVQLIWVVCTHHGGSVASVAATPARELWAQFPTSSAEALLIAGGFLAMQLILLVVLPGAMFYAAPTPMGNRPGYRLNGVLSFAVTHALLAVAHASGTIRLPALFDSFGALLASLNQVALVATLVLYVRGHYWPTNSDSGPSGHGVIWDLWQGTELHPEIAGISLKQLINCRFAMMGWSVAVVAFALKQKELTGAVSSSTLVSAALQMLYIFKFFWWEDGYFNSVSACPSLSHCRRFRPLLTFDYMPQVDIIHDRFGFYIFWGCSAFLPSVYTLPSLFLATHPINLGATYACALLTAGTACVWANYDTDRQRQQFRATGGRERVWGKPPRIVHARYVTGDGVSRDSLLLASGWWGVSRHVNYVFEIGLALCWSLPAGTSAALPYLYVAFLTILLSDRAFRDELRCQAKYGQYYAEYCRLVPYRMVPGVY